jgi:transposase
MSRTLLTPELWQRIERLLPLPTSPGIHGGRPPVANKVALEGILYVLKTGIPWEDLPDCFGCCGMTCWRRLRDWHACGAWTELHKLLLNELRDADKIDWSRAVIDSSFVRALGGGEDTGPSPVDRRKLGSKHHILVDGNGIPLAAHLTAANVPDVMQLIPLIVDIPAVAGKPGRPRSRPDSLQGDRGYDSDPGRWILRWLGIRPVIARRNTEHGSGLGCTRWVVERTIAWFHNFGRLRTRRDRRSDIHEAFMELGQSLICLSFVLA